MHVMAKVAVVYYGAADLRGCRLALAVAEGAWDAGAEVRVRRVEQLTPPAGAHSDLEWAEVLREAEEVPEASAEDLTWADVVLFGTSIRDGALRAQLGRLIHTVLPVWGGVVLPFGASDQDGSTPVDPAGPPSAAELASAREDGRRIAEAALAVKAGRSPFADVA
jgi:hypothetical protein